MSLKYYAKRLFQYSATKCKDSCLFNLVSLWFQSGSNKETDILNSFIPRIIASKFLPLSYQLFAKLFSSNEPSQDVNSVNLCKRIFNQFPERVFFQIYAIRKEVPSYLHLDGKVSNYNEKMNQLELLANSLIELAFNTSKDSRVTVDAPIKINSKLKVAFLKNLCYASVLTVSQPLEGPFVHVIGYSKTYKIVGGINQPKLVECCGSDGNIYTQLIKSKDDLRQDAVTQQVFHIANSHFAVEYFNEDISCGSIAPNCGCYRVDARDCSTRYLFIRSTRKIFPQRSFVERL